jgi:hypothetical protein
MYSSRKVIGRLLQPGGHFVGVLLFSERETAEESGRRIIHSESF